MTKRILGHDPSTRTTTYHHFDHSTGKTHIEEVQDVSAYLERNKRLALTPEYQARGKKLEFMHIATIPNSLIVKFKAEHGIDVFNADDLPKLERLLMSNEYKYLRTVDRI
jgi:hypothetical protein